MLVPFPSRDELTSPVLQSPFGLLTPWLGVVSLNEEQLKEFENVRRKDALAPQMQATIRLAFHGLSAMALSWRSLSWANGPPELQAKANVLSIIMFVSIIVLANVFVRRPKYWPFVSLVLMATIWWRQLFDMADVLLPAKKQVASFATLFSTLALATTLPLCIWSFSCLRWNTLRNISIITTAMTVIKSIHGGVSGEVSFQDSWASTHMAFAGLYYCVYLEHAARLKWLATTKLRASELAAQRLAKSEKIMIACVPTGCQTA
jgi:hypothetical protein